MADTPNIRLFGDKRAGAGFIRPARQILARLRSRLDAAGVESGGTHGRLADGVYCYVRIGMGVSTIGIVADSSAATDERPGIDRAMVPDFLSGIAYTGEFNDDRLDDFRPSRECAGLFELEEARQEVKRLGVEIHESFPELGDDNRRLTQYAKLRPTMYSGTMRKLVQLLMGYGFLPDRERDEESIYGEHFVRESESTFDRPPTDFERAARRSGLQIQYDYRFARTHGLTRAADGKWWVVEIADGRGVHAMPIELYKGSMTDEFRGRLEDMGDAAGLSAIDIFGGFPIGVPFPSSDEELEAKVRAGMILRGLGPEDLEQFYELTYYSTACGWAFSESGMWAVNSGWKYGDDGVQIGEYYKCRLVIGEMDEIDPPSGNMSLKRHLLSGVAGRTSRLEAVLFKVDRLSDDQVRTYLRMRADEAFSSVDELVVEPLAEFDASIGRHGAGKIFWPTAIGPQIKFWEPMLEYLVSHDMRPDVQQSNADTILCDTVMFAFFIGEELNFVKYYKGPGVNINEVSDGFETCMFSGEWTYTTRSGRLGVPAMFYTSRLDDREEIVPSVTEITLRSVDLGYTSCRFGDVIGAPHLSFMVRTKTFLNTTTTIINNDRSLVSAVCVPEGMREAYYYALITLEPSKSRSVSNVYSNLADPNWYSGWRNFPGYTGTTIGNRFVPAEHPSGCGRVTNRHVSQHNYSPSMCGEFADSGQWASICQQIEPMAYNINLPPLVYENEVLNKATLTVKFVTNTEHETILCKYEERSSDFVDIGYRWGRPSPDPESFVKDRIYARANALGDSTLLVYCSDINEFLDRKIGSPQDVPVNNINHNYIGVFNV